MNDSAPPRPLSLPAGLGVDAVATAIRDDLLRLILVLHIPLLALGGLVGGAEPQLLGVALIPVAFLVAERMLGPEIRATILVLGLVSCGPVLTWFFGGRAELVGHALLVVILAGLYHRWVPLLVAVGGVLVGPVTVLGLPSVLGPAAEGGLQLGTTALMTLLAAILTVLHWEAAEHHAGSSRPARPSRSAAPDDPDAAIVIRPVAAHIAALREGSDGHVPELQGTGVRRAPVAAQTDEIMAHQPVGDPLDALDRALAQADSALSFLSAASPPATRAAAPPPRPTGPVVSSPAAAARERARELAAEAPQVHVDAPQGATDPTSPQASSPPVGGGGSADEVVVPDPVSATPAPNRMLISRMLLDAQSGEDDPSS